MKSFLKLALSAVLALALSAASFAQGKATQSLTLTVNAGAVSITTTSVPMAVTTVSYTANLVASGGVGPYTFAVTTGSLPAGLTLSTGGIISGTATATGTSHFTVQVSDSESPAATAAQAFSIVTIAPLTFTTSTLPSANAGVPYSATVTFTGGLAPYTCSITAGSLPTGLTLSTVSGGCQIAGTPTADGTFNLTLQVTDSATVTE